MSPQHDERGEQNQANEVDKINPGEARGPEGPLRALHLPRALNIGVRKNEPGQHEEQRHAKEAVKPEVCQPLIVRSCEVVNHHD